MSLPTRWIICTKWYIPKATPKLNVNSEQEGYEISNDMENPFWTPMGTKQAFTRHGKVSGIPVSYATEQEARSGLKEQIRLDPELVKQKLSFVALEVKYVPNRIKAYKKAWRDKYVVTELELEFTEAKFTDKMK